MQDKEKQFLDNLPKWGEEASNPDDVTVKELEAMCDEGHGLNIEISKLEDQISTLKEKKNECMAKVRQYLEYYGKSNYASALGSVEIRDEISFKIPQTEEDKRLFFEYLKEIKAYDAMISVNSRTLNSFCKEQNEIAKEENKELKIPGIGKPEEYKKIYLRSKK